MYAGNSRFIKQGNFSRKVMPQPLDSGAKDGLTVTPDAAAQGQINYIAPKQTDVQQAPVAQQQVRR